jgi:hypothetical protein
MSNDREHRIRERAHQIWEREGRPDGQEQNHWERASREIDDEERTQTGNVQSETPSRERSFESSGNDRATSEPGIRRSSSSHTGMQDPQNMAGGSSKGENKA